MIMGLAREGAEGRVEAHQPRVMLERDPGPF